jgi:hypothetical protein
VRGWVWHPLALSQFHRIEAHTQACTSEQPSTTFDDPFAVSPYRGQYGGMHDGAPAGPKLETSSWQRSVDFNTHLRVTKCIFAFQKAHPPSEAPWKEGLATFNEPFAVSPYRNQYGAMHVGAAVGYF